MVTLACDLDVFVPSIPTGLAAIVLARGDFTETRDVRTGNLLLIGHLRFPPLQIPFLFSRSESFYCVTSRCIRLSTLRARSDASFSLRFASRQPESMSKARHSGGVRTRHKRFGTDLGLAYTSATDGSILEILHFPLRRCLAPRMPCYV